MIIEAIINFIFDFAVIVIGFFSVRLADLPYIGTELVAILTTMIGVWNSFMLTFPYAETAWHVFIWVIVPFEITFMTLKFFLGSRLPSHNA